MVNLNTFYFFNNASTTGVSDVTYNNQGDTLTVQVDGTASNFTIGIVGSADLASNNYYQLNAVAINGVSANIISANGIYSIDITGIAKFKANLSTLTSGNATVFGRMTKNI